MADRIEALLEEFATRIRAAALEEAFERMKAAVGGAPTKSGPGRPRNGASPRRAKGGKRDPQELESLVSKLASYVKNNPGRRIEEIAASLGTKTKELALPVKKLLASKKFRKSGNRRATRYFPK